MALSVISDFRASPEEKYRFEYLVKSILPLDQADDLTDVPGIWEYRISAMAFLNAIVNRSDELDERIMLREELARRGLNEVMTVRI